MGCAAKKSLLESGSSLMSFRTSSLTVSANLLLLSRVSKLFSAVCIPSESFAACCRMNVSLISVISGDKTKGEKQREQAMAAMQVAVQRAERKAVDLKHALTDGHIGFRSMAYLGGMLLVGTVTQQLLISCTLTSQFAVVSFLGLLGDVVSLSPTGFVIDVS